MDASVYVAAGGMDGMRRLAAAWHARAVAAPIVGHAFSHGHRDDHVERLAAYLAEALGGPAAYTRDYGDESFVERIHAGNGEHTEMDDEAVAIFHDAVDHSGLPADERLRSTLKAYWAWATRTVMAAHPGSPDDVPDGLAIPRWSWDGPVAGPTRSGVPVRPRS
ncbi:MAG: hypothetical protein MUF35_09035 [Candidatus Nanopelagicales bacterium]|jgi:hemoglobin|nr:hypothetical protein [Candidatus Nanopelagicales bacterium]